MTILQTVKNKPYMRVNQISTSCFYPQQGTILLATSKVQRWKLKDDQKTRIQIDQ